MKSMNKKVAFAVKSLAVVAVVAGVATAGFEVRETKATVTAPSGTCGMVASRNFGGFDLQKNNADDVGSTMTGTLNFDAKTASARMTVINNYGAANAVNEEKGITSTFVVESTANAGTYILTFTSTIEGQQGTSEQKWDLISTNSGNTYLMKTKATTGNNTGAWSGVCQAL